MLPSGWMSAGQTTTDEQLLGRIAQQDRAAFGLLFDRWAPRLRGFLLKGGARPIEADELVQEVMLTVWRKAHSFRPDRASAATWLFTITRNRRIDRIRKRRHPEVDIDDPALVLGQAPLEETRAAAAQAGARLRAAIERLPIEQRDVLMGTYFLDKSQAQVAQEQAVPLGTIKSRTRLAMGTLRKLLAEVA